MKNKGGRPSAGDQAKVKRLNLRLSTEDYTILENKAKGAGYDNLSEYIRLTLLSEKVSPINPVQIFQRMDSIGSELNKIGSNINQFTKYANVLKKSKVLDVKTYSGFNDSLNLFLKQQKEIINVFNHAFRKLKT